MVLNEPKKYPLTLNIPSCTRPIEIIFCFYFFVVKNCKKHFERYFRFFLTKIIKANNHINKISFFEKKNLMRFSICNLEIEETLNGTQSDSIFFR